MTLPGGFAFAAQWAPEIALDEVVHAIPWEQRTVKMFGRDILQPRLTSWMGDRAYTYSKQLHTPAPMPEIVLKLKKLIEDHAQVRFNSVLGNLYRHGSDSVAWHSDDEPELGQEPVIASLSLGATRAFSIRHKTSSQRWNLSLKHGDLLVMDGRAQLDYQHCVPKIGDIVGPRVNLTFRLIK